MIARLHRVKLAASWRAVGALLVSGAVLIACDAERARPTSGPAPSANPVTIHHGREAKENPVSENPSDAAVAAVDAFIESQQIDTTSGGWKTSLPKPAAVAFDAGRSYYWELETNVGGLSIKLMPDVAPMHVTSTIYLTRLGFYDGVAFHRVIEGFMAQGGDPLGNGTGGPGYQYDGEYDPSARHDRPGLLSMANAGPGTDGSQFFLTFVPTPHLDDRHAIFGEVVEGMDTLQKLEAAGSRGGKPSSPLSIERATIRVD